MFELNNAQLGPLKQYKAVEGDKKHTNVEHGKIQRWHPQATIVFQQRKVPNEVNVMDALYDDFDQFGNICIDKDKYCGSTMAKEELTQFLDAQRCKTNAEPYIMNTNTYDVPDCSNFV